MKLRLGLSVDKNHPEFYWGVKWQKKEIKNRPHDSDAPLLRSFIGWLWKGLETLMNNGLPMIMERNAY